MTRLAILRVPGDGNCFYASFAASADAWSAWPDQSILSREDVRMRRTFSSHRLLVPHQSKLRSLDGATVQWLRLVAAARLVRDDILPFCEGGDTSSISSCVTMGCYVEHPFVKAIANATKVAVHIYRVGGESPAVIVRPRSGVVWGQSVHLLYDGCHYDAVVPAGAGDSVCKAG